MRSSGNNVLLTQPAVQLQSGSAFELDDPAREAYHSSSIEVEMELGAILFEEAGVSTSNDDG